MRSGRINDIIVSLAVMPTHIGFMKGQIKFELGIELSFNAVRCRCDRLVKKGLLEKYAPYTYVEKGWSEFYRQLEKEEEE
ncbi:MAG: hypothetical protein J7J46_02845 [Candidatus Desulfofervidus sp.]|nr:hypothetical protein [Candidatus Desulfofervidus sp.]